MTTYITTVDRTFSRQDALAFFGGKVGKGYGLSDIVIIETDKSLDEVKTFPGVVVAERDFALSEDVADTEIVPNPDGNPGQAVRQRNAGWGLSSLSRPYSNGYHYNRGGNNVDIYILDSGVKESHPEFEGRAATLFTFDGQEYTNNTHGTRVASCAAGSKSGVAKKANIFSCRTGDGTHQYADTIKALDTVAWHHWAKETGNPSVVNMSTSSTIDSRFINNTIESYRWAIHQLRIAGIVIVASAGNNNLTYSDWSEGAGDTVVPAGFDDVLAVGSYERGVNKSVFTGNGPGVALYAPGSSIEAASYDAGGTNYYQTTSGTSFSAPYTAGAIALLLEGSRKPSTSQQVGLVLNSLLNNLCKDDFQAIPNSSRKALCTYNYTFWAGFSPMFP